MERYFSGGVAALVALMAAHRTAIRYGEASVEQELAGFLVRRRGGVQQDVALDADLFDQVELPVEKIDVLFLAL